MARLPTQKKILPEEYPAEVKKWIPQLLEPLNRFMEEVTRALNRQLTFGENISAEIKTVVLDGEYPVRFRWNLRSRPIAAWVGQCREISENHTIFTSPVYMDWEFDSDGMFRINNVVNVTATPENKYNLTVVATTG